MVVWGVDGDKTGGTEVKFYSYKKKEGGGGSQSKFAMLKGGGGTMFWGIVLTQGILKF